MGAVAVPTGRVICAAQRLSFYWGYTFNAPSNPDVSISDAFEAVDLAPQPLAGACCGPVADTADLSGKGKQGNGEGSRDHRYP